MGVHSSFPPHELSKFSTPTPKDQTPQHLVLRTGCIGGIEGPEGRRTCATSSDHPAWDITSPWGNSRTRIGWNGTSSQNQAGPNAIVARTRTIGRQEYRTSIQGTLQIQRYCEVITQRICRHRNDRGWRHPHGVILPGLWQRIIPFPTDWHNSESFCRLITSITRSGTGRLVCWHWFSFPTPTIRNDRADRKSALEQNSIESTQGFPSTGSRHCWSHHRLHLSAISGFS